MASEDQKDNRNPQPGDMIEIFRVGYQHWALYIGDDFVVHYTATSSATTGVGLVFADEGMVKKEKLQDVVGTSRWRVNNSLDDHYKPRPVDDIVKEACAWIDFEDKYDVALHNCEHFATCMRYGKAMSRQVMDKAKEVVDIGVRIMEGIGFFLGATKKRVREDGGLSSVP